MNSFPLFPAHAGLARWLAVFIGMMASKSLAQTTAKFPADSWLTRFVQFPRFVATNLVRATGFETLQAEAIAGKLKVTWQPGAQGAPQTATLFASADEAAHWPVRDWRAYPMSLRGGQWETFLPVDSVDVPLAYFVRTGTTTQANYSLVRLCLPRAAGLEEPSRIFSPFLEGFEETLESWHTPGNGTLRAEPQPKNGKFSLLITLPAGQGAQTISTTRVRGWQVAERGASGVRLWLRTPAGTGRARFTFHASAESDKQVTATHPLEAALTTQWQRVDLPFAALGKFPLGDLDLFSVEFTGETAREFLVDDLSLLGRWKLAVE